MRCDECKHWEQKINEYDDRPLEVRTCNKPKEFWNATEWKIDTDDRRVLKEEFTDLKMFVQDGSGYHAELLTKADFFCYHHEAK